MSGRNTWRIFFGLMNHCNLTSEFYIVTCYEHKLRIIYHILIFKVVVCVDL
jgi:hypothetical protein